MPFTAPILALLALPFPAGPLATLASAGTDELRPPPGMVLVEGGRTKIGSSQKEIERLVGENHILTANFGPLTGETPQTTADVQDFFLMVTEVTNEQYAVYVRATVARPPFHWATEVVDQARKEFLEREEKKRAAAKAAGDPPPPREEFKPQEWWTLNWPGKSWSIPKGEECKPVVYVDYQDALGYARWAGLRLMTEEEYQRAARGDSDRPYPWGDRWEDGMYAATIEIKKINATFPVGHFAEGASGAGLYDLAGNVWEWTASRFVPYPGYRPLKMTVGKGSQKKTLDNLPGFNPDHRVVVGGSFQNTRHAARATIRRGTAREQQTNSLGFRCAASTNRGHDMAETLMRDIPIELLPQGVDGPVGYDLRITLALDRWQTAPPSCDVPRYETIEGYEYVLFTPVEELYQVTMKDLRDYTLKERLAPLGFLATDQQMIDPALEPGTYLVSFRGAGESVPPKVVKPVNGKAQIQAQEPGEAAVELPLEQQLEFDWGVDNYILFDLTGKPVSAIPARSADLAKPTAGSIAFFDRTVKVPLPAPEGKQPEMVDEIQKWLDLSLAVPARGRKVFRGSIHLRFAEGVAEKDWRG